MHEHTPWRELRQDILKQPGAGAAYEAAKARLEHDGQQEADPEDD